MPTPAPRPWTLEQMATIRARAEAIDATDSLSLLTFGNPIQHKMQTLSAKLLDQVQATAPKDAGAVLEDLVFALRSFTITTQDVRSAPNFWERLLRMSTPLAKLMMRFDGLRNHLDGVADALLHHEHALLQSVQHLDTLEADTAQQCARLDIEIAAGALKINDLTERLPHHTAHSNPFDTSRRHEPTGLHDAITALQQRVRDLRTTRDVATGTLASVRGLRDQHADLAQRLAHAIATTLPVWEDEMARAFTLEHQGASARTADQAHKVAVRAGMQQGHFDHDHLQRTHQALIDDLEQSLSLAQAHTDTAHRLLQHATTLAGTPHP